MKKIPMITLLLAPYVFLAVIVLECMAEGGFTAKALETVSQVYCVMFLLVMLPNMIYAFVVNEESPEVLAKILTKYYSLND